MQFFNKCTPHNIDISVNSGETSGFPLSLIISGVDLSVLNVVSSFALTFAGEVKAGGLTLIVLLMSCGC